MPPPHLAVLNEQNAGKPEAPARGLLSWLRGSVTHSFAGPTAEAERLSAKSRMLRAPPLLQRPAHPAGAAAGQPTAAPTSRPAEMPDTTPIAATPSLTSAPGLAAGDRRPPSPLATATRLSPSPKPRPAQEDLLADLPPAQVPLRIGVTPLPASATAAVRPPIEADGARPPAAERAFRTGRGGARPAHAMSAVEIAAWSEGAMEAGRGRDPIFGRPRLWWWLALSLVLILPLAYAAGWLGLPGSGAEFLSTPVGQEAWILVGGPDAAWLYWGMLLMVALTVQFLRPLEPVLILCAATWSCWTALHAAWVAGWLAQRIPPLPLPG